MVRFTQVRFEKSGILKMSGSRKGGMKKREVRPSEV
jgi:hypothetical protein